MLQRAGKIREETLSKDHPDYGKVLLDLALVYRDEGKYAKAQTLCTQATKIIQPQLGRTTSISPIVGSLQRRSRVIRDVTPRQKNWLAAPSNWIKLLKPGPS